MSFRWHQTIRSLLRATKDRIPVDKQEVYNISYGYCRQWPVWLVPTRMEEYNLWCFKTRGWYEDIKTNKKGYNGNWQKQDDTTVKMLAYIYTQSGYDTQSFDYIMQNPNWTAILGTLNSSFILRHAWKLCLKSVSRFNNSL